MGHGFIRRHFHSEQHRVPIEVTKLIVFYYEKQKEIELKVSKHRGHYCNSDDCHPRNLLDTKKNTFYVSKEYLPAVGDWIEFAMSADAFVIPTKIRIRNSEDSDVLKEISLSIGSGNGSWHKLIDDITDIQKQRQSEQEFVFGE